MSVFNKLLLAIVFLFLGIQGVRAQNFVPPDSTHRAGALQKRPVIDRWIAPDKGLHLLGSMMLTVAGTKTLQQNFGFKYHTGMRWAMGFTFSLGVSKELWDSTKPHNIFSWKDLSADVVGILLGRCILEIR